MSETRELARFVARTTYADLPAGLVERARVYVLDNLAAGYVGSAQPWSGMVADTVQALGGAPQASVFRRPWRTDVSRAALVNGVMLGAFEAEHFGHAAHPSATVFPAALAVAEHLHVDGRAFVLAMLLGYEVVCRVGAAQTRATELERGFHNPGVNGAFGAAAAVGKLLGLDAEHLGWALGVAGSHACGLVEFVFEGAMTKRAHPGRAAQLGLESALLARAGFSGPTTVLEGRHGYLQAYSPSPRPERLVAGLGQDWLAAELTIKAYACHATSQAVVEAIQRLKSTFKVKPFDPRAVRRVLVSLDIEARYLERQPTTLLGAQYSLPFTTAVALARDLANPSMYDAQALADPLIRELAGRVEIAPGPPRVMIDLDASQRVLEARDFPGSPTQPLDFAAASEKLRRYAGPVAGRARTARLVDLVERLQNLEDVSLLARAIAARASTS
jgi:2-methylcitrate dehydratase PrpD